eukprot:c1674_g1_i1.p1 GENE.c1674_g1_i1~~c1674_g1_i1.p1  ORF type:complete len:549 (-),score=101.41 c1674_g1_i1:20-1666(-)
MSLVVILALLIQPAIAANDTSTEEACLYDRQPHHSRCDYVKGNSECAGDTFDFLEYYACADPELRPLYLIFYFFLLFSLFYLLGTTADKYFCPQLEELADRLGLTPRVAGVTLLSLGNGAPDVFSGIAAINENQVGLVLGQLTGGGMFTVSVVAGGVLFVSGGIRTRFPLLRDVFMYLCGMVSLSLLVAYDALSDYTAVIMLCYYVFFVALAYWSDKRLLRKVNEELGDMGDVPMLDRSNSQIDMMNQEYRLTRKGRMSLGTVLEHFSKPSETTGQRTAISFVILLLKNFVEWVEAPFTFARDCSVINCVKESWSPENHSRLRASMALCGTPLLFGYWQDLLKEDVNGFPIWAVLLLVGIGAAIIFAAICPTDMPPRIAPLCIGIGFFTSAIWVNIFANQLVDVLTAVGRILSISEVIMGATVLAWGNCVGDLTSDILLARNKREGMAITACFAGPMFNLLIVMGFGVLLHSNKIALHTSLSTQALISFTFLFGCLTCTLLVAFGFGKLSHSPGNRLPEKFAFFLWALYLCYVVTMILYEVVGDPEVK